MLEQISGNWEEWTKFLSTASRVYKYPFLDQLMIYAQRPDATACADYETWNRQIGRSIRQGASGIALLDDASGHLRLRYVFDITDTVLRENSRTPWLWTVEERHHNGVSAMLEHSYGARETDLSQQLIRVADRVSVEYWEDQKEEIFDRLRTREYDGIITEELFFSVVRPSIAYVLMARCGLKPASYFGREDFAALSRRPALAIMGIVGKAISRCSERVLREISDTIRSIEKERNEGRAHHGHQDQLHSLRGLHDPGSGAGGTAGESGRQIRDDAKSISEGAQTLPLRSDAAGSDTVSSSGGDRRDSGAEIGRDDAPAGQGSGSDRGAESQRSDALGGADEQLQSPGRRNLDGGADLQLSLFPSEKEQVQKNDEAEDENASSAFSISPATPVGYIEYLGIDGTPVETMEYTDADEFLEKIKEETFYGVPFTVVFYRDKQGHTMSQEFLMELDPPPMGFRVEDAPVLAAQREQTSRYEVIVYHHIENGFDEKLDYPTLEEAREVAQKYVAGSMEPDGFAYEGAAVYDLVDKKYLSIYGDYPDKKAHEQLKEAASQAIAAEGFHTAEDLTDAEYIRQNLIPGETTFDLDGRTFQVSKLETDIGRVELRDVTFANAVGFPIFRAEPISVIRQHLERGPEQLTPATEPEKTLEEELDEHPISVQMDGEWKTFPNARAAEEATYEEYKTNLRRNAQNFHITDDHLGEGGPKVKFQANVNAIRLLKELETTGQQAGPEQQEVLSRYVGWGGLPDAFDPGKESWSKEYALLKDLLTPEEYAAARASTLNAHYTSPTVIRAIYEAVGQMGFRTGNILEPSCGVGNFFGLLPENMAGSKLYGVELDSISGRIARQLYPKADITVAGFEVTDRRDFYDLAVGNVPFGQYQVNDKAYNKLGFSIHNYFFAKALDQVRPGGVVAFITSRYTMDAKDPSVRRYLAQRAELLGAIRLPNNAFKANAGTEVVSDIIFLQKRERPLDIEPDWTQIGQTEDGFTINQYFIDHPEMVLGRPTMENTQYGRQDYTVVPIEGRELADQLHDAIRHLHGTYQDIQLMELQEESIDSSIIADPNVKNYSYALIDGVVYYRENSRMVRPDLNAAAEARVKAMVELRDCVQELIDLQMDAATSDGEIQEKQAELNRLYDLFSAKHGLINDRKNRAAFSNDSSYYLLCALEIINEDGKLERKADMFTKRTIKPHEVVTSVDTASEALAVSIAEKACVDMAYMEQLTGKSEEELVSQLQGVIFRLPDAAPKEERPQYVTADEYLSGNVREKLEKAQKALETSEIFRPNVEALEQAQPPRLNASEIDVRLGATWIDPQYIRQFVFDTFQPAFYNRRHIQINFSPVTSEWQVSGKSSISRADVAAYMTYGTQRASAYRILEDTLNLRDVRIYDTLEDNSRVLNQKETMLAQQKQQAIKDAFQNWIWQDPQRRQNLEEHYNVLFNSTRPREYNCFEYLSKD